MYDGEMQRKPNNRMQNRLRKPRQARLPKRLMRNVGFKIMTTPFDSIAYGPFKAAYHRERVDADFKAHLVSYLTEELLPQVTITPEDASGSVQAVFDDDKNCGPHSAVKHMYKLSFTFRRGRETEEIEDELVYDPATGDWRPRWPHPLM